MNSAAVLCYVSNQRAYFTTCPLDKQWGDDWNDAPYEHNAGQPYEWREYRREKGTEPYVVDSVFYDGPLSTPDNGHCNSPWSVEQINAGHVAWLRTDEWFQGKPIAIHAGTTYERFCELVHEAGGTVYERRK